jgi:hypothetical protein
MRWSERPPALRSSLARLQRFHFERCALSVAVAHLGFVRSMKALVYLIALIPLGTCSAQATDEMTLSLLRRSDAVVVGQLQHYGWICATGGNYVPEQFEVLAVLAGTVSDKSITVGFQRALEQPSMPHKKGEKMILFLQRPAVPVRGFWVPTEGDAGTRAYTEALEQTIKQFVSQR